MSLRRLQRKAAPPCNVTCGNCDLQPRWSAAHRLQVAVMSLLSLFGVSLLILSMGRQFRSNQCLCVSGLPGIVVTHVLPVCTLTQWVTLQTACKAACVRPCRQQGVQRILPEV